MTLDREFQRELLERLQAVYPKTVAFGGEEQADPVLVANAWYLMQHGLIQCTTFSPMNGDPVVVTASINEAGLDFLADDGGLTAIRGVVTFKLHQDSLLQLIEARLAQAPGLPEEKSELLRQIRTLPGETIKHLTTKLLDMGLADPATVIQLLQNALSAVLK